jgi:hypothetical protein
MPDSSNAAAIRQRFEALYGKETTKEALAEKITAVFQAGRASAYRWLDEGFPVHVVQRIDLLERLERQKWPDWAHYPVQE